MSEFLEKRLVLSEMERLAFSNFGKVASLFKDRYKFNRKIRNSKTEIKIFPAGGDPMILPRKISFHGSIQKERVVLCYRCMCKTWHMLGESCPDATPTPEDSSMSFIEQSMVLLGRI